MVCILLMVVLWCSAGGRLAHADKRKDDDVAEAKRHFKRAQVYQRKKRYDEAAREYLLSYQLYQNADLLFNAAEMYRVDGKLEQALEYYRKYLTLKPDGRASPNARKYIVDIRRTLGVPAADEDDPDRSRVESVRNKVEDEDEPLGDDELSGDDGSSDAISIESGGSSGSGGSGRSRGNGSLRMVGIGGMIGGGVSLALAARAGSQAQDISNELSANDARWSDALLAQQKDGQKAEQNMFIFAGVGVALGVAGSILYFMSRQSSGMESDDLSITPLLAPDDVGIALSGRF